MVKITKGLNIPIEGDPVQIIDEDYNLPIREIGILGSDYPGLKPKIEVNVGDLVQKGQVLFSDKANPGVNFSAPLAGRVAAIHRGARRAFQSMVIDVEPSIKKHETIEIPIKKSDLKSLGHLQTNTIKQTLNGVGFWVAFRTRPYNKVPKLNSTPHSIFITAIDTHPLAPEPAMLINNNSELFMAGIKVIEKLTEGKVFICKKANSNLLLELDGDTQCEVHDFDGPHPAGLPGTHIHFLDPVSEQKTVWHVGYQDVIAIGALFLNGELHTQRVIALAGPQIEKPRLIRTYLGANLTQLTAGQMKSGRNRIISGSVFGGYTACGAFAYLGRYHNQVTVLLEGTQRHFMHWLNPAFKRHTIFNFLLSRLSPNKKFAYSTTTNGSERAMIPMGNYEEIMPLDLLATQLLRAIVVGDTVMAQRLGVLELAEEDLALCTYVCAGKYEYGPILRDNLTSIELEG